MENKFTETDDILVDVINAERTLLADIKTDDKIDRDDVAKNLENFMKLRNDQRKVELEYEIKSRELDVREKEAAVAEKKAKNETIKSWATLGSWLLLSVGVMVFEQNGGAIMSKAFPGIFPKSNI